MDHSSQGTQLPHRVLERQPEDLTLRDTRVHRAEQSQPCIHDVKTTIFPFRTWARDPPCARSVIIPAAAALPPLARTSTAPPTPGAGRGTAAATVRSDPPARAPASPRPPPDGPRSRPTP